MGGNKRDAVAREADVAVLSTMEVALKAMSDIFRLEGEGLAGESSASISPTSGAGCGSCLSRCPAWDLRLQGDEPDGRRGRPLRDLGLRPRTGGLRGILDARVVTAMRTAAASGVATRALAREHIERSAIIGTGQEARTHLLACRPSGRRPRSRCSADPRSTEPTSSPRWLRRLMPISWTARPSTRRSRTPMWSRSPPSRPCRSCSPAISSPGCT